MKTIYFLFLAMLIFFSCEKEEEIICESDIQTGIVYGTWTKNCSPYLIHGNIWIEDGTTLEIEAGVEVIFQDHYRFDVNGQLLAKGTESEMITITAKDTLKRWNGLRLVNVHPDNDSTILSYCNISYAYPQGDTDVDKSGGGVALIGTDKVEISHCQITHNKSYGNLNTGGAGIGLIESSPIITQNLFKYNRAIGGHGGGMAITDNSYPRLENNIFSENYAFGGGALVISDCEPILYNNTFVHNSSAHGGTLCAINGSGAFVNCILHENTATNIGNEVHLAGIYNLAFYHCQINGGKNSIKATIISTGQLTEFTGDYENIIEVDPLFDNLATGFGLEDNSPCLGKGTNQIIMNELTYTAPSQDYFGNKRPNPTGSLPDIGAIESELGGE